MNVARFGAALLAILLLCSCGEEGFDARGICSDTRRLAVSGTVGPSRLDDTRADALDGVTGDTFLTVTLESGDAPHIIALTTNTVLDQILWSLLATRVSQGGENAGTLSVAARPAGVPCDPREGVICAAFGVDTNRDGVLFGANEVVYPAESGDLVVTHIDGNTLEANYSIAFGPSVSGDEPGGETGGTLEGCFVLYRTGDGRRVF